MAAFGDIYKSLAAAQYRSNFHKGREMSLLKGAKTWLEKDVQQILNNKAEDYDNGATGVIRDLQHGGCSSGLISELVYYHSTVQFYKKHRAEIVALLKERLNESGFTSPVKLFGDQWDTEDVFADEDQNRNLLAWFGFEETAFLLAQRNNVNF